MSQPPRKRIIRIPLTPRQKKDPKAILEAVRAAFKRHGDLVLRVDTVPENCDEPRIAQEQLEAAALARVARALDREDQQAAAQSAQPLAAAADPPKSFMQKTVGQVFKEVAVWFGKLPGRVVSFSGKLSWEIVSAAVKKII
jgi:hypothetical protein